MDESNDDVPSVTAVADEPDTDNRIAFSHAYVLDRETESAFMHKFIRKNIVINTIVAAAAAEGERISSFDTTARRELHEMRRLGLNTYFDSSSLPLLGKRKTKLIAAAPGSTQNSKTFGGKKRTSTGSTVRCPWLTIGTVCEACYSGDGLW